MTPPIAGFSKLSKNEKIHWLSTTYFSNPDQAKEILSQYWNTDTKLQQLHDEFIENTVSNYYLPLGVAPNFLVNNELYTIPMAVEESSVVAAASKAAKYWHQRGGFKTEIIGTVKIGHVHFMYDGDPDLLETFFNTHKDSFLEAVSSITANMRRRGGGVTAIKLENKTAALPNYYQLHCEFETLDAMGANFINSCLEQFAQTLSSLFEKDHQFTGANLTVIMSILSNYVPNCVVKASVSCPVDELGEKEIKGEEFAQKFVQAIQIAKAEPYRAVTHNKGVMNGIDAVVIATGNDFRAVEAAVHAYAGRNGSYTSLTHASIEDGVFTYWIEIPLALGTVGGLTKLHPLAQWSLELMQRPNAKKLMELTAVAGLAQNFAALRSLVTTGIQKGHMKMHLMNILNQLEVTSEEKEYAIAHFTTNTVSHSAVVNFVDALRS